MKPSFLALCLLLTACSSFQQLDHLNNPLDEHNPETKGDPYQLVVENKNNGVQLTWQAVDLPGVAGYAVLRSADGTTFERIGSTDETSFLDTDISDGESYTYRIAVVAIGFAGDLAEAPYLSGGTTALRVIEDLVVDWDGDGKRDTEDEDLDGDGVSNLDEAAQGSDPEDKTSVPSDLDKDGKYDFQDDDRDGDGVSNTDEAAQGSDPEDKTAVPPDLDKDGKYDFQDDDRDGDGQTNDFEEEHGTDPDVSGDVVPDTDDDGLFDFDDEDIDGDEVPNEADEQPNDRTRCHDLDLDTCDECAGGILAEVSTDGPDLDYDGLCDAGDPDQDGDAVPDANDAFPRDPKENLDTDLDGIGNMVDPDDDGDGVLDVNEIEDGTDPTDRDKYLHFKDLGDFVADRTTGLVWQHDYIEGKTWQEALDYCDGLTNGGHDDWSLPSKETLEGLMNSSSDTCPYSDFPDMPCQRFWSSSSYINNPNYVWGVNFILGSVSYGSKNGSYAVRCVRP